MVDIIQIALSGFFPAVYSIMHEIGEEYKSPISSAVLILILISVFTKKDLSKITFSLAVVLIVFTYSFVPDSRSIITTLAAMLGSMIVVLWALTSKYWTRIDEELAELENAKQLFKDNDSNNKINKNLEENNGKEKENTIVVSEEDVKSEKTKNSNNDRRIIKNHMKNKYGQKAQTKEDD